MRRVATYASLQSAFDVAQNGARWFIKVEIGLAVLLTVGAAIWLPAHASDHAALLLPVGAFAAYQVWSGLSVWTRKHKRLEDLRPDFQFGSHSRESLLALSLTVKRAVAAAVHADARLASEIERIPVFLMADKTPNAHALRRDWLPSWHRHQAVTLNRSTLHLLSERELMSVLGHELGHAVAFVPESRRYTLLHAYVCVLGLLLAVPWIGWQLGLAMAALAANAATWLEVMPGAAVSQAIELLCDDLGAQVAGTSAAVSTEIKLAREAEAHEALQLTILTNRVQTGSNALSSSDLQALYEEMIPYGAVDRDKVAAALEAKLKGEQRANSQLSWRGFLRHALGTDDDADSLEQALAEQRRLHARLQSQPVISVTAQQLFASPLDAERLRVSDLVLLRNEIENGSLVARTSGEIVVASTHPPAWQRVLYLCQERERYPA